MVSYWNKLHFLNYGIWHCWPPPNLGNFPYILFFKGFPLMCSRFWVRWGLVWESEIVMLDMCQTVRPESNVKSAHSPGQPDTGVRTPGTVSYGAAEYFVLKNDARQRYTEYLSLKYHDCKQTMSSDNKRVQWNFPSQLSWVRSEACGDGGCLRRPGHWETASMSFKHTKRHTWL